MTIEYMSYIYIYAQYIHHLYICIMSMCIFWSFSLAVAGLVWPRGGGRRLRRLCHSCHGAAGVVATRALRLHGAHLGGSPWRNDRKNILLLSKFYILMSIYIYIFIYIGVWTYFHIFVAYIYIYATVKFHGLVSQRFQCCRWEETNH